MTLWAKDNLSPDAAMLAFTTGDDATLDNVLIGYDLVGSAAHVRGLEKIGVLTAAEARSLINALRTLRGEFAAGHFRLAPGDEDCHSAIERELVARLGDVGKKIHTGRSRNDQVLTALRLLMKNRLLGLMEQVVSLAAVALEASDGTRDVLMPGYTHGQRAMPSTLAFWYASFAEGWCDRARDAVHVLHRLDASPLGAAAGFGVPLALDREYTAGLMGFKEVQVNAGAVQNSRGRLEAALLNWLVEVARDVEKMTQDLWLFSTAEFGFVRLDPSHTTGSSLMPNKRNPDVLELLRATTAMITSCRNEVEAVISKLPSGYQRDFQLTKGPLLRGLAAGDAMLTAAMQVIPGLQWDRERMAAACTVDLYATHRAMDLVRQGVPFRDAYQRAAEELAAGKTSDWKTGVAALSEIKHAGSPGDPSRAGLLTMVKLERGKASSEREVLQSRWDRLFAAS